VHAGDVAWVLVATALVLLMTPALALFYGGLVRRKHAVATMLQVTATIGLVSLQWVLFGYSLAFGPDIHGLIGGLGWAGLSHVGAAPDPAYAPAVPNLVFALFQMMFAVITPALIVGACVERLKFSAFAAFTLLWSTFVYDPLAHWVWGAGGWLRAMGLLDFAGGTVVHISAGVSALVAALVLGRRRSPEGTVAHNLPLVLLGTGLLWFGWFGFNAGSALAANALAATALLNTNTAAAAGLMVWLVIEHRRAGRASLAGACTGAICGLAAVTPACGFVSAPAAAAIGGVASVLCYWAIHWLKPRLGYDDTLDVFGGHGVGGVWGVLATGLFATAAVNRAAGGGLLTTGQWHLIGVQALGIVAVAAFSAAATWGILRLVDATLGLRVDAEVEDTGLDRALHGELAYTDRWTWEGEPVGELPAVGD
jgi:Amt family ammonium transporter